MQFPPSPAPCITVSQPGIMDMRTGWLPGTTCGRNIRVVHITGPLHAGVTARVSVGGRVHPSVFRQENL